MDLGQFLQRLQGAGSVEVGAAAPAIGDLANVLGELDAAVRLDGPAGLPPLDLAAATWAVERLYQGCVLLVHREFGVNEVAARLAVPCPVSAATAATHYSVDLALRHLPDLLRLARGLAPADPLVTALRQLGAAWPLSSVGIDALGEIDASVPLADPGLRALYVDRILATADRSRAGDPRVARAILAAVGAHTELADSVLPREAVVSA